MPIVARISAETLSRLSSINWNRGAATEAAMSASMVLIPDTGINRSIARTRARAAAATVVGSAFVRSTS